MNRILTASLTLAVALAAMPAQAGQSPNARALDAHYETLKTEEGTACFDFDGLDAEARQKQCEKALEQLEKARKAKRNPSVGEVANFDYRQVTLQAGLSAAFAELDRGSSKRGCALLESNLAIRNRLRTIPESDLSADAYDIFQNPPPAFYRLVTQCRATYGTPQGAPALPG